MSSRIYVPFTLFNLRIVNMQHLWTPSTEYRGQPTQKPNYFGTCILDRTQMNWWDEPALAPAALAYNELVTKSGMQWGHISEWPIKDGNMPPEPGKPPSEWAKNRWIIGGSSSSPIKVEMAQPNGSVTPLPAKVGVKPGDYVALGLSAAIKQNNARGVKNYCNTVLFMGACPADQEIAVGQSVTGAEMMAQAQKQGIPVQGFQPSGAPAWQQPAPGGYPGQPQPGFTHGAPSGPQPGFAPNGGQTAPGYGATPAAPAPGGTFVPGSGSATYHSDPGGAPGGPAAAPFQPPGAPQPGFTPPAQYQPQQGYAPQPGQPQNGQWQAPPNFNPGGPR